MWSHGRQAGHPHRRDGRQAGCGRRNPRRETLIIARTDARAPEGLPAALAQPTPTSKRVPTCCSSRRSRRSTSWPPSRPSSSGYRSCSTGSRAAVHRHCSPTRSPSTAIECCCSRSRCCSPRPTAMQATLDSLRSGAIPEVDPVDDPFTSFTNTIGLPLRARHRTSLRPALTPAPGPKHGCGRDARRRSAIDLALQPG